MTLYAEVPTEGSSGSKVSVTLDWDRDLEMLPFTQKRAEMSPAEARALTVNLRHAADCALTGELIRESVFLEQAGFGELSVVTGCGEEVNLCFGDGDHCFARFSLITELSIAQANLLASELDSSVDAIEELLPPRSPSPGSHQPEACSDGATPESCLASAGAAFLHAAKPRVYARGPGSGWLPPC